MDLELLSKILDLFDHCKTSGKPLQISVEHDLSKILPMPRKLILDFVSEGAMSILFYLSGDQNILRLTNNLNLCSIDQTLAGSCYSSSCDQLHICKDFLLNNICSIFNQYGKCSHSHSLSTKHNQYVIERLKLPINNERTFEIISRVIKLSLKPVNESQIVVVKSLNEEKITEDLIDQWLGEHKSFLIDKKLININTIQLIFDDDEVAAMIQNFIMRNHRRTALVKTDFLLNEISSKDLLSDDTNFNKQPDIIEINKTLNSSSDNVRQDKDLDKEVELTNQKVVAKIDQRFENTDENSYLNKSSSYNPLMNLGRGRGKSQLNNSSGSPTFSTSSSSSSVYNKFSPNNLNRNNQLSSVGPILPNERKRMFSQRLNSEKNKNDIQSNNRTFIDHQIDSINTTKSKKFDSNNHNEKSEFMSSSNIFSRSFQQSYQQQQQINSSGNNDNSVSNHDSNGTVSSENMSSASANINSKAYFLLHGNNEKLPEKNSTLSNYFYKKPFSDQQLCYLLGPGKEHILENSHCKILSYLPSGYCRLTNIEQGKDIEKRLYSILPKTFNVQPVNINHNISLIVHSSAAENIFQQNQKQCAIITEPFTMHLNIDLIYNMATKETKASSTFSKNSTSSSVDDINFQQASSDGKFYISATGSSIDVISDDISQIPVDMMICISTSNNLRESVLRCAGHKTQSEYEDRYQPTDALLLDGGLTAARKILFVPWRTDIEETDKTKIQKSLSDLVKWCIEQAQQRQMKSISFPPIGTGQLGLDSFLVCESMISAASEWLNKYKMDVVFVIYPSSGVNEEDECYQIFRIYLNDLCEQIIAKQISIATTYTTRTTPINSESENKSVQRDIRSKRVLTLSSSSNMIAHHDLLIDLLQNLIFEKTWNLSLIESSLLDKIDLLIDICLKYNVYPRIDFVGQELKLCGDQDSCFQCFYNLRKGKNVHQYSYVFSQDEGKMDTNKMNSFISLKIDEAFAVNESNICIKDDDDNSINIDLDKLQIKLNRQKQSAYLIKRRISLASTITVPSSWSASLFMINTREIPKSSFESLKSFKIFHETMPKSEWEIEQMDSIENYPLYNHFMNAKKEKSQLYFHGCSYASVQSIIHYGLHSTNASNYGAQFNNYSEKFICLTSDSLNSHLYGTSRSTDGRYYMFAVDVAKTDENNEYILLTNEDTNLALPMYLIIYRRRPYA